MGVVSRERRGELGPWLGALLSPRCTRRFGRQQPPGRSASELFRRFRNSSSRAFGGLWVQLCQQRPCEQPEAQSSGWTEVTHIFCSRGNQNPRRGFPGDAALNFSALAFSPLPAFYDSLFLLLETPSTDLLGAHLGGCLLTRHPKRSCCWWRHVHRLSRWWGTSHSWCDGQGRSSGLASSERLMLEQQHCPPPLFP